MGTPAFLCRTAYAPWMHEDRCPWSEWGQGPADDLGLHYVCMNCGRSMAIDDERCWHCGVWQGEEQWAIERQAEDCSCGFWHRWFFPPRVWWLAGAVLIAYGLVWVGLLLSGAGGD